MRLLIYSHDFAPSIGGVETVVLTLARGLAEQRCFNGSPDFDITLVTQTPGGDFQDAILPFSVIRQPTAFQLRKLIHQTDILHVAGPALVPILYGLLLRKPIIIEHHGFQVICPTGQLFQEPDNNQCPGHFMAGRHRFCLSCSSRPHRLTSFRLWLLTFVRRVLCRWVSLNITPTAWLAAQLQLPRSETVHHGVPLSPQTIRSAGAHHVPVFVFVGRLVTTKGVHLLLEACRILSQQKRLFELLILGEGPQRASLEAIARNWQLTARVRFLGRATQGELSKILQIADLVVAPSIGGEVFGMVVAECMLCGIPVITSDLGSFGEVLGDAGITFRTGDPVDLARQIVRVIDDPSQSEQMRVKGQQRVLERFSLKRMVQQHSEIYRRFASTKAENLNRSD